MDQILIANDNPRMLDRLSRIAKQVDQEFQIIQVSTQEEALAVCDDTAMAPVAIAVIDLYLTDPPNIHSPEGLRVARRIRERFPHCYSVLFTIKHDRYDYDDAYFNTMVSAWYENRAWRAQLKQTIEEGRIRAIRATAAQ